MDHKAQFKFVPVINFPTHFASQGLHGKKIQLFVRQTPRRQLPPVPFTAFYIFNPVGYKPTIEKSFHGRIFTQCALR